MKPTGCYRSRGLKKQVGWRDAPSAAPKEAGASSRSRVARTVARSQMVRAAP